MTPAVNRKWTEFKFDIRPPQPTHPPFFKKKNEGDRTDCKTLLSDIEDRYLMCQKMTVVFYGENTCHFRS